MRDNIERESKTVALTSIFSVPERCLGEGDIEISGGTELCMTGCRRVLEYSQSRVKLRAKKYSLLIEGEELRLTSLSGCAIRVNGMLTAISFERKRP